MDLRKPLFLEHLLSSKRRVVSGFGVGAAASLLVIFLLLFLSAPPAASSSSSSSLFSWFFSVPEQQKAVGSPSPEEGLQTARGDGNSSRMTVEEEAGGPSNHSASAQDLSGKIQFQEDKPTPSVAIKDGGSGTAPPEENARKGNLSSSPRPSNGTHPSGGGGIPEKTQYATRKNASRDGDNGKIFELKDGVGERNRLDPGGGGGSRSSGEGRASERVEEEEEAAAAASAGKNNSSNNSRSRSNNKNNNNNGSAPSKAPGLGGLSGKCDIFDGRWVRDEHEPFYPAGSCPFIDGDFDCHKNGRPDDGFLKWRWQPYRCDIPR